MLLATPRGDVLFAKIASRHARLADGGSQTPGATRRALRKCYPNVDLYRQAGVLIDGVPTTVWFAYRDGRLAPSMPASEWWNGASIPRAVIGSTGLVTQANSEFRALVGLSGGAASNENLHDRLDPELCDDIKHVAAQLAGENDLVGSIAIRLPWGQRRSVEFHARRMGRAEYRVEARSLEQRDADTIRIATEDGLSAASGDERQKLLGQARRRDLAPGEGLGAHGGDPWAVLVVAGIVRVLIHADGSEPTIAYASHGALLGSHLGPVDESGAMDVEAVTPSVVLRLSASSIRQLIQVEASFARAVMDQTKELVGVTMSSLVARSTADLPQRLAREIMLLTDLYPARSLIPVTEKQLADGVGSIRESVGRTLGTFRRSGWIATTGHGLIVLDETAMRATSKPELVPAASLVGGSPA